MPAYKGGEVIIPRAFPGLRREERLFILERDPTEVRVEREMGGFLEGDSAYLRVDILEIRRVVRPPSFDS